MAILLVEDDEGICKSLTLYVEFFTNQACYCASTLEEAKEIIQKTKIDVIFLDLLLADSNGAPLIEWVRERYKVGNPIIVVMTAMVKPEKVLNNYPAHDHQIGRA